ncbi:PEP/pyruvate-binding domain-containing protein [Gracilibacillus xinjiangensis]|uniref:Phosphoenolpyruvate synthase n=1 Tax=Gracilibacillus xinjiangensis TaxID=1193282 RepID=A0ABV8WWW2_9BACI
MQLKVSTGMSGFDETIDSLRLGDNVVWQVDNMESYQGIITPFVHKALEDNRKIVYVRFGQHKKLVEENDQIIVYEVDAKKGFESFATEIHRLIEKEGNRTFYVFDSLTDLLTNWYSDLMIGNFFKVCCPYLYELETVAYFAINRNVHTYSTIARIRETTQVLLDLYEVENKRYIHPLKVWQRYSPTMFFPHLIEGNKAKSITASSEASSLFANVNLVEERMDYWDVIFAEAKSALRESEEKQESIKQLLMSLLIGEKSRMYDLCNKYFTLEDILRIASREVGTGFIGGKSVGMLLARKILRSDKQNRFNNYIEAHDSFYIGSDIFYTYIVQNGWWKLRVKQKTKTGYYQYAKELKDKIRTGKFPANIKEQFVQVLEYFGQSPIIVRSSSLLEDNFGNAFAGKYDSVFCVNQGTPEERYEQLEDAIRTVYASTMNEDALEYRMNRGLFEKDEQMAILIQRVSGDHYADNFFPHVAGVGNSSNLYVWDKNVDMDAGMIRLVFGLGTRAVDRTVDDYAKIVTLDQPTRKPLMHMEDQKKFSQHGVDVLSIAENKLTSVKLDTAIANVWDVERNLFASIDTETSFRLKELGYRNMPTPYILDFKNLLKHSKFPEIIKEMLAEISRVYDYPVDVEFTANFRSKDDFKINIVQCRPLQTKGLGKSVEIPTISEDDSCFIQTNGNFMGGNIRLPIDYVIYVDMDNYLNLNEQDKYSVARIIGKITRELKDKNIFLVGPGRWGTSTPSLGVPVHFSEIQHVNAICEIASQARGFMPELSYGSHFFQDIVESDIFYAAVFDGEDNVRFEPNYVTNKENMLRNWVSNTEFWSDTIHVSESDMELLSDIVNQKLLCK